MSGSFMDSYKEVVPKTKGIPYVEMNAPLVQNTLPGHIGIEMEIEGNGLLNGGHLDGVFGEKTKAFWEVKQDGSLRGGMEYVLNTPCDVTEVAPLVNTFFERAENAGMRINNSNRCSTHVHINISGLKVNNITAILALWCVFENALIAWNGEERMANHFCLSTQDEDSFVDSWVEYLRTGGPPNAQGLKYSALNILPIWTIGSVEFRCGRAPEDPQQIIRWATFLWNLCKYAKEHYPNPHEVAFDLSERGATEILRDICAEGGIDEEFFLSVVTPLEARFDGECLRNFRNAQPFVLGFPWDEWQEEINKEFVPNPFAPAKKPVRPRNPARREGGLPQDLRGR